MAFGTKIFVLGTCRHRSRERTNSRDRRPVVILRSQRSPSPGVVQLRKRSRSPRPRRHPRSPGPPVVILRKRDSSSPPKRPRRRETTRCSRRLCMSSRTHYVARTPNLTCHAFA